MLKKHLVDLKEVDHDLAIWKCIPRADATEEDTSPAESEPLAKVGATAPPSITRLVSKDFTNDSTS